MLSVPKIRLKYITGWKWSNIYLVAEFRMTFGFHFCWNFLITSKQRKIKFIENLIHVEYLMSINVCSSHGFLIPTQLQANSLGKNLEQKKCWVFHRCVFYEFCFDFFSSHPRDCLTTLNSQSFRFILDANAKHKKKKKIAIEIWISSFHQPNLYWVRSSAENLVLRGFHVNN